MAQQQTQALARLDNLPPAPLARVDELRATFEQLSGRANLVTPVAQVDSIPAFHAISLRVVMIDASTNKYGSGGEVYYDAKFCENDEVALGGVALQKIAAAAGVHILSSARLDDRSDPNYCNMQVTIGVRDFDGTYRQVTKSKEVDLRDGAPETMKPEKDERTKRKTGRLIPMDPSAIGNARRHIQSLAETKAFYRALRTLLTIKQKYTRADLAKPFVIPKLVPALDPSDPDQKAALINMAVGREGQLYGAPKGEVRQLQDAAAPAQLPPPAPVPPPPVQPPDSRGPVVAAGGDDEEEEPEEEDEADDYGDVPEPPAPTVHVCACPCSCQREITAQGAQMTTDKVGAPRCRECYPGNAFNFDTHKDVANLQLPKAPKLRTADDVRQALQAVGARK